jgi:hypothetical protein
MGNNEVEILQMIGHAQKCLPEFDLREYLSPLYLLAME